MTTTDSVFQRALSNMLTEIFDGPPGQGLGLRLACAERGADGDLCHWGARQRDAISNVAALSAIAVISGVDVLTSRYMSGAATAPPAGGPGALSTPTGLITAGTLATI